MTKINLYLIALLFPTSMVFSMPKVSIKHQRTVENYAQIQVKNETTEVLICHVAIDGYKIKFRLMPLQPSTWYKATDTRFNYKHFSVWCDYLSLHPKYQEKE